jgi:hypothetical protein
VRDDHHGPADDRPVHDRADDDDRAELDPSRRDLDHDDDAREHVDLDALDGDVDDDHHDDAREHVDLDALDGDVDDDHHDDAREHVDDHDHDHDRAAA